MGQGHLQAPQGNRRTLLCRCQAIAWSPLCPIPKSLARPRAVPPRRNRSEHQEDRHGTDHHSSTQARIRTPPGHLCENTQIKVQKNKPRQNDGVCQQSEGRYCAPSAVLSFPFRLGPAPQARTSFRRSPVPESRLSSEPLPWRLRCRHGPAQPWPCSLRSGDGGSCRR